MSGRRSIAATVLGFRVAYGVALVIAPGKVAGNRWLGPGARTPAATVALRGLGAREIAVHGIALGLLARGGAVRPWLAASVAGDVADVLSAFASRDGLPDGSSTATAAVAGGSAVLTAAVAAALDE
ncbi:MAG TPA: hypothetical protein VJ204_19590 [Solirubrobacterales bacterium]|nr:hypothetical protein [Solirubrobacterales bacterium]